jgi:hypothetical protein
MPSSSKYGQDLSAAKVRVIAPMVHHFVMEHWRRSSRTWRHGQTLSPRVARRAYLTALPLGDWLGVETTVGQTFELFGVNSLSLSISIRSQASTDAELLLHLDWIRGYCNKTTNSSSRVTRDFF